VFLAKQPSAGTDPKAVSLPEPVNNSAGPSGDPSLIDSYRRLSEQLKAQISSGAIHLKLEARGLVVTLEEKAFFPSGDDGLYAKAYPSIESVAKIIRDLPNPVRLEGHTDAIPIHTDRFKNNWELSTARSIAVLQLFSDKYQLDASRFSVAGYAQNAPVASNDTEEGRARNRRVEIVILARDNAPADSEHRQ
jgi:chemotaxis protein MotB